MTENSALIAMSGGVDSSVAAWLMLQRGFRCEGVTMQLLPEGGSGAIPYRSCCSKQDLDDAAQAAFWLGIPHEIVDLTADFRERIIEKFIRTYEAGGTPNPCIDCNRFFKFGRLLRLADERGLACVATGHYARIDRDPETGLCRLKKALDPAKDQSYVLAMLSQAQIARVVFPLGETEKAQTRRIAERLGLENARKRDSQDICFVPDGDYVRFMERCTGKRYPDGDFLDGEGRVVGRHRGAVRYTIGQRKGLGLALGEPVYVCRKDMAANTVTVGPESALYARTLTAGDANWISGEAPKEPLRVRAKTRYRQTEQWAVCRADGDRFTLEFDEPQRAITVGQAAVLYDGDVVLGGGTIERVGQ